MKVSRGLFNYCSSNTTFYSNNSRLIHIELVGTKIRLEGPVVNPDLEYPIDDIELWVEDNVEFLYSLDELKE